MATLARELRRQFETTIIQARRVAEVGARKALEQLAVHHHEPYSTMTGEQRTLRNRLRAHGRQLGDKLDERRDTQTIDRLTQECAYEHWHRMLFARFLAESDLLIEPESGVAISLEECRELAREKTIDWLQLASQFAVRMLSQIFRIGDPVLELSLPLETRQELEGLLKSLQREVFTADDSLGWVYQFWQTDRKREVNDSEKRIGADELASVTQLFTEDYMVLFLLHNALGAWWAGKVLGAKPEIASHAKDEDELRAACSVGGYKWTYLRFVRDGETSPWRPAAGTFEGWPRKARDLKVLDPCEGSGHFLLFALPILVAFRVEEEGLSREQAVDVVLRDNLFGLELDNRCTQIAAFNLALAAWWIVGHRQLPPLNIAFSGLGINAKEDDWLKLAGKDELIRETMRRLYHLFQQAPVLGSLIDPRQVGGTLFVAEFEKVQPLLEKALATEQPDDDASELAVTAQGLVQAARILADEFTLVATNVPYLGRVKQTDALKLYLDRIHCDSKWDLATAFVERCQSFCSPLGTFALVTPQQWCFGDKYISFRKKQIRQTSWTFLARLGTNAFTAISGEVVNVILVSGTCARSKGAHTCSAIDVSNCPSPEGKANALPSAPVEEFRQLTQLNNPDSRITLKDTAGDKPLSALAKSTEGLSAGDGERFILMFWEKPSIDPTWAFLQSAPPRTEFYSGLTEIVLWEDGEGGMAKSEAARIRGHSAWGKKGIVISKMNSVRASVYMGGLFSKNCVVLSTTKPEICPALFEFVTSHKFATELQVLDANLNTATSVFEKVQFEYGDWQLIAAEKYPDGLPKPHSADSTQWIFDGMPSGSEQSLRVAVARLVGYRWPRQGGSSFPDCPALGPDGLEKHADRDGIVCLNPAKGDLSAADRLRALLADAFGSEWSGAKQAELLSQVGHEGETLEDWLRDGFFEQHCELFHHRPFIWHVWDGLKNGFHALVNYHRLASPNGEGRRTFEKLIYAYIGDWIKQQRDAQKRGIEGADARVAAAEHLKSELEKILEGEYPYDIFVRWKPLHEQPIEWEPDLNDGVRMNIRPFMTATTLNGRGNSSCILRVAPKIKWDKDRGKEPHRPKNEFPWFWGWDESDKPDFAGGKEFDGNRWNDLHYTREFKRKAREKAKG